MREAAQEYLLPAPFLKDETVKRRLLVIYISTVGGCASFTDEFHNYTQLTPNCYTLGLAFHL